MPVLNESWDYVKHKKTKTNDNVSNTWFDTTVYCYATNRDCDGCFMSQFSSFPEECKMPEAVQKLLNKGVKMSKQKQEYFYECLGNYDNITSV